MGEDNYEFLNPSDGGPPPPPPPGAPPGAPPPGAPPPDAAPPPAAGPPGPLPADPSPKSSPPDGPSGDEEPLLPEFDFFFNLQGNYKSMRVENFTKLSESKVVAFVLSQTELLFFLSIDH
uniref:Uncharacterized protein n=1 Tax=Caenorhabditis japonica TaxID=281687 RepID=A0A8R1ID62_CAEJA